MGLLPPGECVADPDGREQPCPHVDERVVTRGFRRGGHVSTLGRVILLCEPRGAVAPLQGRAIAVGVAARAGRVRAALGGRGIRRDIPTLL